MIFVTILLVLFFLILIYLLYYLTHKNTSTLVIASLITILTFIFLLGGLIYESISQLNKIQDYNKLGPFGDYIGGIVNPLISVFAVVAAGFAFYAQYQANKQVQMQFKIQQFESQFYEMLHLHRENLNEMKIDGYELDILLNRTDKEIKGKKIFVSMLNELISCYKIINSFLSKNGAITDKHKDEIFHYSYYIFFFGLDQFEREISVFSSKGKIKEGILRKVKSNLKLAQKNHSERNIKDYENIELYFKYKPFTGHQSRLAHYYRHLFQTVKFVVKQNESIISYESKRDYLRILRSMLSNHEQVLLFLNWFSDFGYAWEEKNTNKRINKSGNYFFTDYRMIHNLNPQLIDSIFDYEQLESLFSDYITNMKYENNRKDFDTLFELIRLP